MRCVGVSHPAPKSLNANTYLTTMKMREVKTGSGTMYVADFCSRGVATKYVAIMSEGQRMSVTELSEGKVDLDKISVALDTLNKGNDFLVCNMVEKIEDGREPDAPPKVITDRDAIEKYLMRIDRHDFDELITVCNEVYNQGGKKNQ